ncbi:MAG: anti-sigma factor family protein [Actinomycetota bacterium]
MELHEEIEALSAYLDGEVDGAERARIEEHLAACPACAGQKAALEQAAVGMSSLLAPSLTPDETRAIRLAVLEAVHPSPRRALPWTARVWAAAGALAVLAVGIVGYVSLRPRPPTPSMLAPPTDQAAPASNLFNYTSEDELRDAVASDPEISQGLRLYRVADAGQYRRATLPQAFGGDARVSGAVPVPVPQEAAGSESKALAELPASDCVQGVFSTEKQPLLLLQSRPAAYRDEAVWLLVFATSSSPDQQAPLDRIDARLVSRGDCSLRARYSQLDPQSR